MRALFSLALLGGVLGSQSHSAGPGEGCVDITTWHPVNFTVMEKDFCTYKCTKVCEKKSKKVCVSVPLTTCEARGFKQCTNTLEETRLRDDKTVAVDFTPHLCSPASQPGVIVETKLRPDCKNVTKEKCDSRCKTLIAILIAILINIFITTLTKSLRPTSSSLQTTVLTTFMSPGGLWTT